MDSGGRILLVREDNGVWELPGGGLEHGEDPRQALAREFLEETGMTVTWVADRPKKFWTFTKEVGAGDLKWFAMVAYEAKVVGTFRPDPAGKEAQEAGYFSLDQIRTMKLHVNTRAFFS